MSENENPPQTEPVSEAPAAAAAPEFELPVEPSRPEDAPRKPEPETVFAPLPPPPPRAAARPPVPPRRDRSWVPWVGGGCLGCLPWLLLLVVALSQLGRAGHPSLPRGERVGLISIEGPILGGSGSASFLGYSGGADEIVRQLDRARRDSSIRAVVLRINSPGGSAAASQEIYEEVMKIRKARKPVIASMGDMAASGGYYVAAAADKIMANGSTLTGSIGVIMEMQNLQGLFDKIGIGSQTIKSGKFKDIGSSTRPMTAEERRLLQGLVDDTYEQFVEAVSAGRRQLSKEQVRRLADGRIFTGRQARALNLVDTLGNLQDAIALAGKEAGIEGRPVVVEMGKRGVLDLLVGESPEYGERLRLPNSGAEEERLLRVLRRLLQEGAPSW